VHATDLKVRLHQFDNGLYRVNGVLEVTG